MARSEVISEIIDQEDFAFTQTGDDHAEAVKICRKAIEEHPDCGDLYLELFGHLEAQGKGSEGIDELITFAENYLGKAEGIEGLVTFLQLIEAFSGEDSGLLPEIHSIALSDAQIERIDALAARVAAEPEFNAPECG